jgi:hypothetical protein
MVHGFSSADPVADLRGRDGERPATEGADPEGFGCRDRWTSRARDHDELNRSGEYLRFPPLMEGGDVVCADEPAQFRGGMSGGKLTDGVDGVAGPPATEFEVVDGEVGSSSEGDPEPPEA